MSQSPAVVNLRPRPLHRVLNTPWLLGLLGPALLVFTCFAFGVQEDRFIRAHVELSVGLAAIGCALGAIAGVCAFRLFARSAGRRWRVCFLVPSGALTLLAAPICLFAMYFYATFTLDLNLEGLGSLGAHGC